MKRYRILCFDFDTRAKNLEAISDSFEYNVKILLHKAQDKTIYEYSQEFGNNEIEDKIQNIKDLGSKAISVLSFHNKFYEQARRAFIMGAYYPALTGVCALGERILNLLLTLRDDYQSTPEYIRIV